MKKRLFDILLSTIGLIVLSPIFLILGALVWRKLGGPVFFKQIRPGKNGKLFTMFKFRTMLDVVDSEGKLAPDSERLVPFGAWLRATSLDELPELWNVLKGDMSIVGPRPLLVEYLSLYNKTQHRRHEVRPGITGLAQINGRNNISWEERFELDVTYVDSQSFLLDLKILFMTILKVVKREGIVSPKGLGSNKFKGS